MNKYQKIIALMNSINSSISLQALLATIIDSAKEILQCEGASLLLLDEENGELIFDVVVSEKGEIIQGKRLGIGEGIAGHVAETREPMIVNDARSDSRFYSAIDQMSGFVTRNIAAVPVRNRERYIGVLEAVNRRNAQQFSDSDVDLLRHIADAAAIAINNHELMISLKNRVDELTCIYEISQSIYFTFDIDDFLLKILGAVNRVIKAERCSFLILDDTGGVARHFVTMDGSNYAVDLENSLMGQVIRTGDPLLVLNVDDSGSMASTRPPRGKGYRSKSFICIPMKLRDRVIGVLNVTDKSHGGVFDSFDLRVLSTVANQVAETYENVLLQKQQYEMERLGEEVRIAAKLQEHALSFIPGSVAGANITAFTMPSSYVSGDFFDVTEFDDRYLSFAVGDVSGKGVPAAIYMSTIRNALHFESVRIHQPDELMAAVNRWAYRESHHGMFCTLFYCLVDRQERIIHYASAGQDCQLFLAAAGGPVEHLVTEGKALGIRGEGVFRMASRPYCQGDVLVVYSDGLADPHFPGEIPYEEFLELLQKSEGAESGAIVARIKERLARKLGHNAPDDDCTLMTVNLL